MTLRIGIAGCGFIASVHALAIQSLIDSGLVDASIAAVLDIDPERSDRFATQYRATAVADADALVAAVDVVWVCTWTAEHGAIVRTAARAGRAVFCEKPLAMTLAECELLAEELARVPHQVGLVLRHAPVFDVLAAELASGRCGQPLATILRDDQFFPTQGMYASEWRKDVACAGGGTLLEHSIHDVDILRRLFGDPEQVSAHLASRFGNPGIDDIADVRFVYVDDSTATLVSVWHQVLARPSTRRLEILCEDAVLWLEDDHLGPVRRETDDGVAVLEGRLPDWIERLRLPEEIAKPLSQYAVPARAFLDAVAAGDTPMPDAMTALAAHRLVDAAYRSAAAGGVPVTLARLA